MFSFLFFSFFILSNRAAATSAIEECKEKIKRTVDGLPDNYKLKPILQEACKLVSDELLGKFADKPIFGEFANKLNPGLEGTACDRLALIIPKLPILTFEQLLEASDVLQVARSIETENTQLLERVDQKLEEMIMSDMERTREHLQRILEDEKRATPLRYQSVLMDIYDLFTNLSDTDCVTAISKTMIVGCGRRDVYKVIDSMRNKWPELNEATPVLFFSILKQLEELAGEIIGGNTPTRMLFFDRLKEEQVPEQWMHRLRMISEGLQNSGFGEVSADPWYRSTPLVVFACLLVSFLLALFTISIYYIFLKPKSESVQ